MEIERKGYLRKEETDNKDVSMSSNAN